VSPGTATVYVGACESPTPDDVARHVRAALDALSVPAPDGGTVVIQPASPWSHRAYAPDACTVVGTIEGVATAFSPEPVLLGVNSLPGFPTRYTTRAAGYDALANRIGARIVRFDEAPTRTIPGAVIPQPDGRGTEAVLTVPNAWLDAAFRVSVPRLAGSTILPFAGALRHLFDLLPPDMQVAELHRIHEAIGLLAAAAPPNLVVLDAVDATHEGGEISGAPVHLGALIVGTDPVAVDLVASVAYGVPINELSFAPSGGPSLEDVAIVGDLGIDELRERARAVRRLDPNPEAFALPSKIRVARSPRARLAGPSGTLTEALASLRRGGVSFDGARETTFVIGPAETIPDGTTDYSTIIFVGDSARGEYKGYSRIIRLPGRNPPLGRILIDAPFAMTVANVRSQLGWRFMVDGLASALARTVGRGGGGTGGASGGDAGEGGGDRAAREH
jgi:uncharacterized protein (DUF362 family)